MDPNNSAPRLIELANTINSAVAKIQAVLDGKGAPSPSFDEHAPPLPKGIEDAQDTILDATSELHDLLTEPLNLIHRNARTTGVACLQVISRYGIAGLIPPAGQLSFEEIAKQTPLTTQMVGRIVRYAVTMRIFREPEPGVVAHTKTSSLLADSTVRDWVRAGTEEMGPASMKFAEALEKWPDSHEPNETAFTLANNMTGSVYDILAQNPERAIRFAHAMKVTTSKPEYDMSFGTDYYDWGSLGEAQVIDVGGSRGHFAIALAKRYPQIQVVVQDMSSTVADADAGDLADRVRFMASDLFDTQSVHADVYFFRWIFHNWSDHHCIRILKAQVPVLKPGARIIIQESILPKPGARALWKEKEMRSLDLDMASAFNSRERTLDDWKALLKEADSSFEFKNVIEPTGSAMGMVEFAWKG